MRYTQIRPGQVFRVLVYRTRDWKLFAFDRETGEDVTAQVDEGGRMGRVLSERNYLTDIPLLAGVAVDEGEPAI